MEGMEIGDLKIVPAKMEDRTVLRNLMSLYLHFFMTWTDDEVNEEGIFVYHHLDRYWQEPTRYPYLLKVGGKYAGFVLVRELDRAEQAEYGLEVLGDVKTHSIAEFFILEKYRHRNVGKRAAYAIFDRYPGRWFVNQMKQNTGGIAFWRRIIGEYTGGQFNEITHVHDGGPVQIFFTPGS